MSQKAFIWQQEFSFPSTSLSILSFLRGRWRVTRARTYSRHESIIDIFQPNAFPLNVTRHLLLSAHILFSGPLIIRFQCYSSPTDTYTFMNPLVRFIWREPIDKTTASVDNFVGRCEALDGKILYRFASFQPNSAKSDDITYWQLSTETVSNLIRNHELQKVTITAETSKTWFSTQFLQQWNHEREL